MWPCLALLSLSLVWLPFLGAFSLAALGLEGGVFTSPGPPLQLTRVGRVLLCLTRFLGVLLFGLTGSPGSSHGGRLPAEAKPPETMAETDRCG